jgi:hypothetical protein
MGLWASTILTTIEVLLCKDVNRHHSLLGACRVGSPRVLLRDGVPFCWKVWIATRGKSKHVPIGALNNSRVVTFLTLSSVKVQLQDILVNCRRVVTCCQAAPVKTWHVLW